MLLRTLPSPQEARATVFGRLLAYHVWNGVLPVLFEHEGRIILDHLEQNPVSIELPPVPRWQLSGKWYSIPATGAPASIGVGRRAGVLGESCPKDTELFGQISTPEIVALEIQYEGAWHRFRVSAPRYIVRLECFSGIPAAYRWLDADGDIVWIRRTACCDREAPGRFRPLGLTRPRRESTIQRAIGLATSEWPHEGSGTSCTRATRSGSPRWLAAPVERASWARRPWRRFCARSSSALIRTCSLVSRPATTLPSTV